MLASRTSLTKDNLINDLKRIYVQFTQHLPTWETSAALASLNYFLKNPTILSSVNPTSPLTLLPEQTGLNNPIYAIYNKNNEIMLFLETDKLIGKGTFKNVMLGYRIDQGQLKEYAIASMRPTEQALLEIELQSRASQKTTLVPSLFCSAIQQLDEKKQITLISEKAICDLHDFINSQFESESFKVENLMAMIWGICYGVMILHNLGIAHNDLRKQNFLIYQVGHLYYPAIIDFGNSNVIRDPKQREKDFIFLQILLKNLLERFFLKHANKLKELGQEFIYTHLMKLLNNDEINDNYALKLLNELVTLFKKFQKQFPTQAQTLIRNLELFLPTHEIIGLARDDKQSLDEFSVFKRKAKNFSKSAPTYTTRVKSKL